ncbi:MAG: bifunctional alpha/beta hydrolase/OsmC family protein [Longimicrobiales bacterium]|nr:bifunctional alpha/beta hydrolase/OsmC family protein [Longimicrobiales bacterium]
MPTQRISFPGVTGVQLAARLELPASGQARATALFAHCFTCSKDLRAAVAISRELAEAGFAVLRFDFTGLGESEGDFADTNFTSNIEDLVAAARWLEDEHEAPKLLVGHSLGGAAVLAARSAIPSVEAIATIGAAADPGHVLQHVAEHEDEIRAKGEATVTLGGRPFVIRESFLDDLEAATLEDKLDRLDAALLVLHSPIDRTVGVENARRIFEAARHPKSFISLDTADHLLSDRKDAEYAARVLGVWAERYLPHPETQQDTAPDAENAAPGSTRVRTGRTHFHTDVRVREHQIVADEPESAGGTNDGPSPYDLLNAALGACTTMTLRMYADRKEWPLDEVRVTLRHEKARAPADDGAPKARTDSPLDRIHRDVEVIGDLTPEQRARLLEIADRCPVHRTLERGVIVETTLAEGDGSR